MKTVDMICINSKEGNITPLKFRIFNTDGECRVFKIDKVLKKSEEKLAGNKMQKFKVEGIVNGMSRIYEMKYEIETCKWYVYKM